MRVVLFASSDFALPLLEGLHTSLHKIVAVYTQPPRLSGRGLRLKYESVGKRARELSIKLLHPEVINEPKQLEYFSGLNVDVAIVAAYGQILSLDLLNIPRFGFLNLHPSLLPRWRGAAPIERTLMAGDLNTGVCTIRMVKELDAGPILAQQDVPIGPETTAQSLSILLSQIGAVQVISILDRISKFILLEEVDSTNSRLQKELNAGMGPVLVCIADQQTAGRGRSGKIWHSPLSKNIYLSISWEYALPYNKLEGLSLAIGVVVLDSLISHGNGEKTK